MGAVWIWMAAPGTAADNEECMTDKRDLVILGGGLVGMTLALAAARAGITSHVVD